MTGRMPRAVALGASLNTGLLLKNTSMWSSAPAADGADVSTATRSTDPGT